MPDEGDRPSVSGEAADLGSKFRKILFFHLLKGVWSRSDRRSMAMRRFGRALERAAPKPARGGLGLRSLLVHGLGPLIVPLCL